MISFQRFLELLAEDRDAEALYDLQQGLVTLPGGGAQFRIASFDNTGGGVFEKAAGSDAGITMESHGAPGAFRFAVDTWDDAGENIVIVQGTSPTNMATSPASFNTGTMGGAEGGDFSWSWCDNTGTPFDPQQIVILYKKGLP